MKLPMLFFIIISLFSLTGCSTSSQREYIKIDVAPSLEAHPDAVDHLQSTAKRLNKILNSIDDFTVSFEGVFEEFSQLDTTMSKPEIKKRMEEKMKKVAYTQMKLVANVAYFVLRQGGVDQRTQEIEAQLSGDALSAFQASSSHVKLNNELMHARGDSLLTRFEELSKLIEAKGEEFKIKLGED